MPIIFHGTGSGGSAKKLKTARTINGTNFDGTANITTANWGTTRTVIVLILVMVEKVAILQEL